MGRRRFKRSEVVHTVLRGNRSVTDVYTPLSPEGTFEPAMSSSPLPQKSGKAMHNTQPLAASGAPIAQSSANADRGNRSPDCSWDWDCSSEDDDLDLRRICRSQEDLSTWSTSIQAWELPTFQESSNTSHCAEPVESPDVASQSPAKGAWDSHTSDNSCNWECSSEEDDIDLRRICRSQEDLSILNWSEEASELRPQGTHSLLPSSEPRSASSDEKADTEGSITGTSTDESLSPSSHEHTQERVAKSDLAWQGPSTYIMLCEERDKENHEGSRPVELPSSRPEGYAANVVHRSTNPITLRRYSHPLDGSRGVSLAAKTPRYRQAIWKPPSSDRARQSPGMKVTTSSIPRGFGRFSCRQEPAASWLPRSRRSLWAPATRGNRKSSPGTWVTASAGSYCQDAPDTLCPYNTMLAQRGRRLREPQCNATARWWSPSQRALAEPTTVTLPGAKEWPYSISSQGRVAVAGLVDTHCHLDFLFNKVGHRGTYAKLRLKQRDTFPDCYEGCVANFCNPTSFKKYALKNELLDEDGVWGAFGCHPHMASEYDMEVEENLIRALEHPRVVALGEIGLDYSYKNKCDHQVQQAVFRRQLELALNRRLPLVIHSRDSTEDTIRIMKEMVPEDYRIHRHCFTGGWQEAQDWLAAFPNLCLGLTPLITFESVSDQPITVAARNIPLDRLLLETDAPYFVPKKESTRLRHSHPGMVIHVATRLSRLRNISVEEILAVTRENTRRIYGI